MYCTKDCGCSLCRELRGYKPHNQQAANGSKAHIKMKQPKRPAPRPPPTSTSTSLFGRINENFILRRRVMNSLKTFQPKSLLGSSSGEIYKNIDESSSPTQQMRSMANATPSPTPMHDAPEGRQALKAVPKPNHKVVIFFGDSMVQRGSKRYSNSPAAVTTTTTTTTAAAATTTTKTNTQASNISNINNNSNRSRNIKSNNDNDNDADADESKLIELNNKCDSLKVVGNESEGPLLDDELPPYIESIEDGVINIKIEGNYRSASALVARLSQPTRAVVGKQKQHQQKQQYQQHVNETKSMQNNSEDEDDDDDEDDLEGEEGENANEGKGYEDEGNEGDRTSIATVSAADVTATAANSQCDSCDWSFVQEWRRRALRPSTNVPGFVGPPQGVAPMTGAMSGCGGTNGVILTALPASPPAAPVSAARTTLSGVAPSHATSPTTFVNGSPSGRIQSPAVTTPAMRIAKELAQRPAMGVATPIVAAAAAHFEACPMQKPLLATSNATVTAHNNNHNNNSNMSSSHGNANGKPLQPHRSIAGPTRLTVQSTPVKSQPAMVSGSLTQQQQQQQHIQQKAQQISPQQETNTQLQSSKINEQQTATVIASDLNGSLGIPIDPNFQQSPSMMMTSLQQAQQQQHHQQHHQQHQQHQKTHLSNSRTHHHEFRALQRVQECCHSSSDENRSSGHHSWSDGHGSSSPGGGVALGPLPEDRLAAGVTNRSTRSRASNTNHTRARHRAPPTTSSSAAAAAATITVSKAPWSGSGLDDIKQAIQQLTMRSQTSTSTYSSLSAGSESSEPARRLGRYASLETVNTNVTSAADEFVWVDSHNRLVELQHPPWSQHCIMRVIRNGRCKKHAERVSVDAVPRLSYLLQRALVRIAREVQRLAANLGLCSKQEVTSAFKIVLCPALADSCIKACLRAAAMFAVTGDSALKQSKSARAGLQLPVGRFHRWMADARLGKFIHEYGAVYLCAGMENLLEEILLQCFPPNINGNGTADGDCNLATMQQLTANSLEQAIAGSGDLWGLLQPFAHLNAGRTASGALTMPRWASQSSLGTTNSNSGTHQSGGSTAMSGGGGGSVSATTTLEHCLLTTCVGSVAELKELTQRLQQKFPHTTLSNAALAALFYFMRCSQLEHNDGVGTNNGIGNGISSSVTAATTNGGQELCYERAYVVLPPLVEWLRVASAHAEHRNAALTDKDDIMQAARLLLPGVDCPRRPIGHDEELPTKKSHFATSAAGSSSPLMVGGFTEDTTELGKRATTTLAFKLMLTGRAELLAQASNLLPPTTRYDTLNHAGLTALMIASIRNDEVVIQALLDAGCDPNVEVPSLGHNQCSAIHPDTQHWTAVTFAASRGNYMGLRILLERGGRVEGGARINEDKLTLTPLQVACGTGNVEVVSLLLAHGANAFLSTQQKDAMCSAGSAQRGCYCAISVAAAHGQRASLRKLLSHPMSPGARDVLSLEEMLAESDSNSSGQGGIGRNANSNLERGGNSSNETMPLTLNKTQIKSLQEAMYHSAENNHLDITIELRTLGVPWTLHCWMHALAAAHDLRLDAVIDQLLQDFLQVCPDDYSAQFVTECLPLLFNIFRYSKNEGTTLLLADIFATCFGWEQIKPIKQTAMQPVNSSRIDPKFVNNPELSDVTFRVEGKIFYGHKIVLVTASPRFQSMLSSKLSESNTPTVQINDIRYHIFQLVMQYLYSGGYAALEVSHNDVLELMAAASFFQLEGLLRYTEARCSAMIDIENVVAMYIHAKVYNANKLLEYCQGFLLQNMVALLTYDDSVKRLLFAKKIPNHDVLSGLLQSLQQRIKQRKPSVMGNFRQQLSSPPPTNYVSNNTGATTSGGSLGAIKK